MIEWINFKGSTEEERQREVKKPLLVIDTNGDIFPIQRLQNTWLLMKMVKWAPLNLPQEEKWERKYYKQLSSENPWIAGEFDNIYSILNQLKGETK